MRFSSSHAPLLLAFLAPGPAVDRQGCSLARLEEEEQEEATVNAAAAAISRSWLVIREISELLPGPAVRGGGLAARARVWPSPELGR